MAVWYVLPYYPREKEDTLTQPPVLNHRLQPPEPRHLHALDHRQQGQVPRARVGQRRLRRRRQRQLQVAQRRGLVRLPRHRLGPPRRQRQHHVGHDEAVDRLCRQVRRHRQVRQRGRDQDHGVGLLVRRRRGHGHELGLARHHHWRHLVGPVDQLHGCEQVYQAHLVCDWREWGCGVPERESLLFPSPLGCVDRR